MIKRGRGLTHLKQYETSANFRVKTVDPDLLEAIDPTVYFDPDLFNLDLGRFREFHMVYWSGNFTISDAVMSHLRVHLSV